MLLNTERIPTDLRPFLIRHVYKKGEYIFTSGNDNQFFYIVESGSCTASMENKDGTVSFVESYNSGDVFGELEIFCKDLKTVEIVAIRESVIYRLHKKHLLEWMKKDFRFTLDLIEHLAESMRRYSNNVAFIQLYNVKQRVAYAVLAYDDMKALSVIDKKNIAIFAKTPIRSVNRALAALVEQQTIEIHNRHIKIINRKLLEEISNYESIRSL